MRSTGIPFQMSSGNKGSSNGCYVTLPLLELFRVCLYHFHREDRDRLGKASRHIFFWIFLTWWCHAMYRHTPDPILKAWISQCKCGSAQAGRFVLRRHANDLCGHQIGNTRYGALKKGDLAVPVGLSALRQAHPFCVELDKCPPGKCNQSVRKSRSLPNVLMSVLLMTEGRERPGRAELDN